MKAILQDCSLSAKRVDSEADNKESFSFKENQIKQSFENEKKQINKQYETLKDKLEETQNEVLELKDIIRLKNQDYEMLRQKLREVDPNSNPPKQHARSQQIFNGNFEKENTDIESVKISGTILSGKKGTEQVIKPYDKSKKIRESQSNLIQQLQEENAKLREQLSDQNEYDDQKLDLNGHQKTPDNDGTVVIGGISNLNLNTTDENDDGMKHYKIEMSPIETKKDASQMDEAILNVFDQSANNKGSKRRLDFYENEQIDKENIAISKPREFETQKSNKDLALIRLNDEIDNLKQNIELKDNKIEELNTRLDYYTNSKNSMDYSSPRFVEPDYVNTERMKNQRMTADKVFEELSKIFEWYDKSKNEYLDKFKECINFEINDQITQEQMSQSEFKHLENISKDDELHLLQTLINLNKLA